LNELKSQQAEQQKERLSQRVNQLQVQSQSNIPGPDYSGDSEMEEDVVHGPAWTSHQQQPAQQFALDSSSSSSFTTSTNATPITITANYRSRTATTPTAIATTTSSSRLTDAEFLLLHSPPSSHSSPAQTRALDVATMTTATRPSSMQGLQQELTRQFAVSDAYLDVLVSSTESHTQFLKAYTQRLAQKKGRWNAKMANVSSEQKQSATTKDNGT
jgi:hypothetical protein